MIVNKADAKKEIERLVQRIKQLEQQVLSASSRSTWFCRATGFCSEYFIIGDPTKSGGAYVFHRDTQTGETIHYRSVGVFDNYRRVAQIPKWVRPLLTEILLLNSENNHD